MSEEQETLLPPPHAAAVEIAGLPWMLMRAWRRVVLVMVVLL